MRLSECIDNYINENKEFLKERTIANYQERKKSSIKFIGDLDIDLITQEFLQDKILELQKRGTTKSSINNMLTLIKSSLKSYKTFKTFRYLREEKKSKKCYSQEDCEKISNYIMTKNKQSYIPIMIAIYTGCRLSEIMGLRWEDIDFEKNIISIKRNVCKIKGKEVVSLPKTISGTRQIPLAPTLKQFLITKQSDAEYYVITNSKKTKEQRCIQRINEILLKKLGIEPLGFHAYRHSFATKLLEVSQDFKAISEIMGHSNIAITQNIYNHPTEQTKSYIVNSIFKKEIIEQQEQKEQPLVDNNEIKEIKENIKELKNLILKLCCYVKKNNI